MGPVRRALFAGLGLAFPLLGWGQALRLEHRLWLVGGLPTPAQVAQLQQVGVDALVLPVGEVTLAGTQATLKAAPQSPAEELRSLPLWALLWVGGGEAKAEAAESLWQQLGPILRGFPFSFRGVVLASRQWASSWPAFAQELQKKARMWVELAAPLGEMLAHWPPELPKDVTLVPLALGSLASLGLPQLTPQDAAAGLEVLDGWGVSWRGGVVVASKVEPPLPAGENPWLALLRPPWDYQPGPEGDVFLWRGGGGAKRVAVIAADGARLQRDLAILLRPLRQNLRGWDSIGFPPPAPTLGLSWEAFLGFFSGLPVRPKIVLDSQWLSPTALKVTVENQAPFATAFATSGNALDLVFAGTEVKDVVLLAASGADFGRREGESFTRAPRGAANTLRLYLRAFPPQVPLEAAVVQFVSRPKELAGYFTARLGDGSEVSGPVPMPKGP